MRYTAPQIVNEVPAMHAIQSVGLPADEKNVIPITQDSPETGPRCTPKAYEADE